MVPFHFIRGNKEETSEAMSCLPEFKERQHFRGTVSLRNNDGDIFRWLLEVLLHFPMAVWLDFSQ